MDKAMSAASSSRVLLGLAALLGSVAGAQSDPAVLSIDRHLTHPVTGESRHEILPVAVFDGTRFQPVHERDHARENSTVPDLLTQFPVAQVLHYGETIGAVTISDVDLQISGCNQFFVGTGDYAASVSLPASELRSIAQRRENSELIEYETETFLALSRRVEQNNFAGEAVIAVVTDPEELQGYAADVERFAPRPELSPLGIDETRAYRFIGQNGVLVVRKRRSAEKIELGNSRIDGTLYTDVVIVRDGPGERAAFPLQGFPTTFNGLGGGAYDEFIDAFALQDGTVYFAFYRYSGVNYFRLYQLGAASDTRLMSESALYARC